MPVDPTLFSQLLGPGVYNPALGPLLAQNPEAILPMLVKAGVSPPDLSGSAGSNTLVGQGEALGGTTSRSPNVTEKAKTSPSVVQPPSLPAAASPEPSYLAPPGAEAAPPPEADLASRLGNALAGVTTPAAPTPPQLPSPGAPPAPGQYVARGFDASSPVAGLLLRLSGQGGHPTDLLRLHQTVGKRVL